MKKRIATMMSLLVMALLPMQAQQKAPEGFTIIENQPAGLLYIYSRSGGMVREVEKEEYDEEDPYELQYGTQDGTVNIVFADDNRVYIQQPVSWDALYNGWMECTLSDDRRTITMPLGQYSSYARSFDMGVQVQMFAYDEAQDTYVCDESITELTFTIDDDGAIRMNGTSKNLILGSRNRAFGKDFTYLDGEWLQSGDYETVFTLFDEKPITPPADLTTESYVYTTAEFDGAEWKPFSATVSLGFDGDNAYMKGFCKYLPDAWIQGIRRDDAIVFPTDQFLGSFEVPIYFKCADPQGTVKDLVLTADERGTYTTTDYLFITTEKSSLSYVNYYMGMTLSPNGDQLVYVPTGLPTEEFEFAYKTYDEDDRLVQASHTVKVMIADPSEVELPTRAPSRKESEVSGAKNIYIQGLWPILPEAWVEGVLYDGTVRIGLPQYMGTYTDEYIGTLPIYLTAYDQHTGTLLPDATMEATVNPSTGRLMGLSDLSDPLSIGINKTGYLTLTDFMDVTFTNKTPTGINSPILEETLLSAESTADGNGVSAAAVYDLTGRRAASTTRGMLLQPNGNGGWQKVVRQ